MTRVRLTTLRWQCRCGARFSTEHDRSLIETGTVLADCPACGAVLSSDEDVCGEGE